MQSAARGRGAVEKVAPGSAVTGMKYWEQFYGARSRIQADLGASPCLWVSLCSLHSVSRPARVFSDAVNNGKSTWPGNVYRLNAITDVYNLAQGKLRYAERASGSASPENPCAYDFLTSTPSRLIRARDRNRTAVDGRYHRAGKR